MHSKDLTQDNLAKIQAAFPNCVTERKNAQGQVDLAVDFDLLRQELSANIVEGPQERYRLDWPGKREAMLTANAPIAKTLRPARDESVNFDDTENLFIEGDNLDALKLLQETYLGKVKMIYIDPPYNTGNDFVYDDDFSENTDEFLRRSNQKDERGNRLISNPESNGRFHSDWLSMIYPRLKLAQTLLSDDGVIFVSINDQEAHNLKKILDEVFGSDNFIASLVWDKNHSAQAGIFKAYHEYVFVYSKDHDSVTTPKSKNNDSFEAGAMKRESARHPMSEFKFPAGVRFDASDGIELSDSWGGTEKVYLIEGRMLCENNRTKYPVTLKAAYTQKNQMEQYFYGDRDSLIDSRGQKITDFFFNSSGKIKIVKNRGVDTPQTTLKDYGSQGGISTALANLFNLSITPIDNPKPVKMLSDFIFWFTQDEDIILDFFAGSATSAHATMQLNAQDGANRKFIMVQLPEEVEEKHEAYKAGYKTIAEVSKERIRRAGQQILEGECHSDWNKDIGFRVLKTDTSNMQDVYYQPQQLNQEDLLSNIDNIKADRTSEDLLFQVLLDWGVDLTLPIRREIMKGKEVFIVDNNALVACFEKDISEELIHELAELEPLRAVFRDNGFATDAIKVNASQIFKQRSPNTEMKAI